MLNVKKIRTRLGVSKYKLCKMTGITKPTLINIEKKWECTFVYAVQNSRCFRR